MASYNSLVRLNFSYRCQGLIRLYERPVIESTVDGHFQILNRLFNLLIKGINTCAVVIGACAEFRVQTTRFREMVEGIIKITRLSI